MAQTIQQHCDVVERCNQRGGRMLSVVDLVEAETLTPDTAAYSLAAIGAGASFMVGALPGGAGKTTVMGALLGLVPADVALCAASDMPVIERGLRTPEPRTCFVCHEIGSGPYFAYLWGNALRRYFELPRSGHMLATNLHADTVEQARDQVCADNGAPAGSFRQMNVLYFLAVEPDGMQVRRRVVSIWESDGQSEHALLWSREDGLWHRPSSLVLDGARERARQRIDAMQASGVRTIEEVREAVLQSGAEQ